MDKMQFSYDATHVNVFVWTDRLGADALEITRLALTNSVAS